MRMASAVAFAAIVASASAAHAQTTGNMSLPLALPYGGDYFDGYHAATPAESFFRGLADGIRSLGAARLLNSEAMINEAEAYRRGLENSKAYVDTYFTMRQMNRERRAAERGPRGTADDYARYARMDRPRLLSPSELDPITGEIAWPMLLRAKKFDTQRESLDQLFARWAVGGTWDYDDFLKARQTTETMLAELKDNIRAFPPMHYVTAVRFVESMAYEVSQPAQTLKGPALANAW